MRHPAAGSCSGSIAFIRKIVRMYIMDNRTLKDLLYEQVARVGKALASPKRLEMLEMLAQGEKSVEAVAEAVGVDIKLASAHLKALKEARLVQSRRDGKRMLYRLSGQDVAYLGVTLRQVAEEHLVELRLAVQQMMAEPEQLSKVGRKELMAQAKRGDVVVLDVRPPQEYETAHLPCARSMPLAELAHRLSELPRDVEIVAYCRGPFCLMSDEAVAMLKKRGFRARKTFDGVSEWQAAGLPVTRP
jgi:DNA-binding transcriptional ArsR family regulator/rhodanese-related sulfurtransferase